MHLVGGPLVMRREHGTDNGEHGVKLVLAERERLGIGLDPIQLDATVSNTRPRPVSSSSGVRSDATTDAPASTARPR